MNSLQKKLENWRLRQHFKRVESILRKRDTSYLSPALQQAREQYLDRLHAYAERGIFPRNYERLPYSPCFIDRDGRECAVAHLVMVAGHTELANDIAVAANYAYVPQMLFPELDNWAAESGFTKEELTLIQPGYWMEFDSQLLTLAIQVWAVGLGTFLINAIQFARKKTGIVMPLNGLLVAAVLILAGLFCLWESMGASILSKQNDVPEYIQQQALSDAAPLLWLGLITLSIAFLTGWLSFYRTQIYIQSKPKRKGRYQASPKES